MKILTAPHYRILFTCLFSWIPWMTWLWMVGMAITIIGIPIYFIWNNPLGFFVGGVLLLVAVFMGLVGLPYQLLSINSSKQLGLLPDVRQASLHLFGLIILCVSIILTVMLCINEKGAIANVFSAVLVLVSMVLIGAVIIGQKYAGAQGMIFLCFGLLEPLYKSLMNTHWALLLVLCVSIWLVFAKNWLQWRPKKFQPNVFGMPHDQLLAFNGREAFQWMGVVQWRDKILCNRAETWIGSLLLGRADGIRSKLVSAVATFLILSLLVGGIIILLGIDDFKAFFEIGGQVNIFIIYICIAYGLLINFLKNLHKVWLYFDGNREDYFKLIERMLFENLFPILMPVLIFHAVVNYLILDWSIYVELILLMAGFAFIVITVFFYTTLFIYYKAKGSLSWSMWVNNALVILAFLPVITSSILWAEHKPQIIKYAICFLLGAAVAVVIFRRWVKQKWMRVDFVRVAP